MTQEEFKKYHEEILRGSAIHLITWIDYHAAPDKMCLSNEECKNIVDALVEGDWGKIYQYMKKKLEPSDNIGESASTDDTFFDDYRKTDGEYDEVHISEHDQKSVHLQFTAEGRNVSDFCVNKENALILAETINALYTPTDKEVQKLYDHLEMHKELNDANVRKEFKWDSENKIMTIYGVTYEEMKALDDFIYCLRSGTKCPKGENGEERFTYQYPPTSIGHNEGINTPGKKPIFVDVDDLPDNPVDAFSKGVEKARSEMKSEPQTVTFIDSGTMQVIDKLNVIIGKLGDIHEVLSKPSIYPYEPIITRPYYTPPSGVPGMDVWYKTHGVEKVTPVTCETTNGFNKSEGNESK